MDGIIEGVLIAVADPVDVVDSITAVGVVSDDSSPMLKRNSDP